MVLAFRGINVTKYILVTSQFAHLCLFAQFAPMAVIKTVTGSTTLNVLWLTYPPQQLRAAAASFRDMQMDLKKGS